MQNHSAIHWRKVTRALALAGLVWVAAAIGALPARAQTYTVLYSFKGGTTDGRNPEGGLFLDKAGNLYGTTVMAHAPANGTSFKLATSGTETITHTFKGTTNGANPYGGLTRDASGNAYGTTSTGGASNDGTVFKLNSSGVTVLHSFTGSPDGAFPYAGLILDTAGNLYGTTSAGGASNSGAVFKLDTTGKETVLYSFTGGTDGAFPYASLLRNAAGNLFGTTSAGGITAGNCFPFGCGVVFMLDTTGKETVLYSFTGNPDGAFPYAGLITDSAGDLFGTTYNGGSGGCTNGCGTVFKLDKTGSETVLHDFIGYPTDGAFPFAGVVRDPAGNLYGTTAYGGASDNGMVFELGPTNTETVLYSFTGKADGAVPHAPLVMDPAGHLYGTTYNGGVTGAVCGGSEMDSCGVVFKLTP
jgi:uncharacterized repeat protein (TIGR03803 family)